ncbi:MAG TPA: Fe-S-containing protein [Candidatus Xenobia bacterium]|nr:Fe-S-containing protein [Candidatus Xenobia bacterium]
MLSALLVSLREGLEAALVVGICLVYLQKIGRPELRRAVWYGVLAALAASLAGAVLLERFAVNQEWVEGVLMLVAAALLVSMIVWMRRVARTLRRDIEGKVNEFAGRGRFAALGLFAFVFAMVVREGIETVIFLSAVALNTEGLLLAVGTSLGLAAAVVIGILFFKGALPIPLHRFFQVTSVMLMVIAVQLILTGIHELSEAEAIPSGPWMMHLLGPIVRNEVFFFVVLLAVAAWLLGRELLQRRAQGGEQRWVAAATATALVALVALAAEHIYARNDIALAPVQVIEADGDAVRIPISWVDDGALHRFRLTHDRTSIRFIIVEKPDGHLVAALEACSICGAHPYHQEGAHIICHNCAAAIPLGFVDSPGGCNPIAVASRTEGDDLVIPVEGLLVGKKYFTGQNGHQH